MSNHRQARYELIGDTLAIVLIVFGVITLIANYFNVQGRVAYLERAQKTAPKTLMICEGEGAGRVCMIMDAFGIVRSGPGPQKRVWP